MQALSSTYDEALLSGWGVRPGNWQFGVSVQQEVIPRVSVEVGYHRRWFDSFSVTDNRAVSPSDYQPYTVPVPVDARLPDSDG